MRQQLLILIFKAIWFNLSSLDCSNANLINLDIAVDSIIMSAVDSKIIFYPEIHLIIWFELAKFEFAIIFAAAAEVAAATLEYHFDCGID